MKRLTAKWKNRANEVQVTGITYYLNTISGNNSNDGLSTSTPFLTQSYAESIMENGDVLLLTSVGGGEFPKASRANFTACMLNDILYSNVTTYGIYPSRTSGVAPLCVHFETDLTASTSETRTFHNLDYTWDFGDIGAGAWGTNNKPKNSAKGAVAAHVYETSGTYTIGLTVKEAGVLIGIGSIDVTISDPETVYAGNKTTCVNVAGDTDFSEAPSGSTHVSTDDLTTITAYATAGSRVLFKRGSSWTATGDLPWSYNAGPVTIGAYGTGTSPDAQTGIFANAPQITSPGFISLSEKRDWRVMDLYLKDTTIQNDSCIGGAEGMQRNLMLRLKIEGYFWPVEISHWNNAACLQNDELAMVSCYVFDGASGDVYIGGERLILLGNIFKNAHQSHVLRVWMAYKGIISNNLISGSCIDDMGGRFALKFHSTDQSILGSPTPGTARCTNRSEFTMISDNVWGTSGPFPVVIGPQTTSYDERITDVIVERNRFHSDYGTQSPFPVQVSLHIEARYCTVRNNIFDGTGSSTAYYGIQVQRLGAEPEPDRNEIYNNTIYRGDIANNTHYGINIYSGSLNTVIRNNVVSFPRASGTKSLINDLGTDTISSNNLLVDDPDFKDPDNVTPLSRNFNVDNDSETIDAGTSVPVYEDFDGTVRPVGSYDIGAYEN